MKPVTKKYEKLKTLLKNYISSTSQILQDAEEYSTAVLKHKWQARWHPSQNTEKVKREKG